MSEGRLEPGAMVQATRLCIKRQRPSMHLKTEGSIGYLVRYSPDNTRVWVDWIEYEPWEHLQRQCHQVHYIEPLGTPR